MIDPLDDAEIPEIIGIFGTRRHAAVRFRVGAECGDLFEEGDDFDGLTLTIEVRDYADAAAMLAAIREG